MKKLLTLCVVVSFTSNTFSQTDPQTPCATSAQGQAGNITISYTIGEMVLVDSWKYSNLMITQGVLQPPKERVTADVDFFTAEEIKLFPNPTPDILTVQFGSLSPGRVSFALYDNTGKLMQQEEFTYTGFSTRQFNMMKYANATYLLKVIFKPNSGREKQGGYRIVKISR
jgi:hypothetical protein